MKLATETVTVFNAKFDIKNDTDVYNRTIIEGVSWHGEVKSAVLTEGLKAANQFVVRIPTSSLTKEYLDPIDYDKLPMMEAGKNKFDLTKLTDWLEDTGFSFFSFITEGIISMGWENEDAEGNEVFKYELAFKPSTQYTISSGQNIAGPPPYSGAIGFKYTDGTETVFTDFEFAFEPPFPTFKFTSEVGKTIDYVYISLPKKQYTALVFGLDIQLEEGDTVTEYEEYEPMSTADNYFTLQEGDVLVRDRVDEELRPNELKKKYGSKLITILGVSDNRRGKAPHFKVVGA